ncbi:hypothetical protein D3C84_1143410 [compost metagenome]
MRRVVTGVTEKIVAGSCGYEVCIDESGRRPLAQVRLSPRQSDEVRVRTELEHALKPFPFLAEVIV